MSSAALPDDAIVVREMRGGVTWFAGLRPEVNRRKNQERQTRCREQDPRHDLPRLEARCHRWPGARVQRVLGDPLQFVPEIACVLPALVGILGERLPDCTVQCSRSCAPCVRDGERSVLEDGRDDHGLTRAVERSPAREHFVEHRPEREDVASAVGRRAIQLFRRQVVQGAKNHAFPRESRVALVRRAPRTTLRAPSAPGRNRAGRRPTGSA